jgi:hypothetical protein
VRQSTSADVALAKIDTPVTDVPLLPVSRTAPAVGSTVRLAGYGATNGDESKTATRLQTGEFRVASISNAFLGMTGQAPQRNTSACPHDSGGPYFMQKDGGDPVLVAVVGRGPVCPHSAVDLGGRVDNIADWIVATVGKVAAPKPSRPAAVPSKVPVATAPQHIGAARPRVAAKPPAIGPAEILVGVALLVVLCLGAAIGVSAGRRRRRPAYQANGVRRHRT